MVRAWSLVAMIAAGLTGMLAGNALAVGAEAEDSTPRQLYNDGTAQLRKGKLREAEALLQGAVASQDQKTQPPALYNLGHVRFLQGKEVLKDAPDAGAVRTRSENAMGNGDAAIKSIDEAMAGNDVRNMVNAYMRGRGARRDLKGAMEAIQRAMEIYGGVLAKWQRALGDFRSAHELHPSDNDAQTNADVVDRSIARLVDTKRLVMANADGMEQKRQELGRKMKALKKMMPGGMGMKMPGAGDDDEDEDSPPKQPQPGQQEEGGSKNGQEIQLTPEEAQRLLGMLQLDNGRKLFIGTEPGKPQDRKGRDW
jgi:tetratricopeptide (TPR) repeat protein